MMMLSLSIILTVGIGIGLALLRARLWLRMATLLGIFLLSNLWAAWPYFTPDSRTWLYTYSTGILASGLASLGFHVAPAWVAFKITEWRMKLRKR
jgi:hypothetical protein